MNALACDLGALDPAERARYAALRAELGGLRLGAREIADGYAFAYPADAAVLMKLAEFVTLERRCCPFFDFALEARAGAPAIELRIGGGAEVKAFLRTQLA